MVTGLKKMNDDSINLFLRHVKQLREGILRKEWGKIGSAKFHGPGWRRQKSRGSGDTISVGSAGTWAARCLIVEFTSRFWYFAS
jgi:hypothetical protein